MLKLRISKIWSLVLVVALLGIFVVPAFAALTDALEFERNPSGSGRYSLTYLGRGGGQCDSNDYRFRVNINQSSTRTDWKIYSDSNSRYQRTPTGRPIYGFQLDTTNAHICVGAQEFSILLHPWSYWTTSGVQSYVYTWRR